MERDPVWDALKRNSQRNHKERVEKTPERIAYDRLRLDRAGIAYELKNLSTGQINCHSKAGNLFVFYASTGKIVNHHERGIHNLITLILKDKEGAKNERTSSL